MDNIGKYNEDVKKISDFVESQKADKIKYEERKKNYLEKKKELDEKTKELNITIENGEEVIENLEQEIQVGISNAQNLIK